MAIFMYKNDLLTSNSIKIHSSHSNREDLKPEILYLLQILILFYHIFTLRKSIEQLFIINIDCYLL